MNQTKEPLRRPVNEIINNSLPEKSMKKYLKTWKEFCQYNQLEEGQKPNEEMVLQYLDMLRTERKMKSSTIWTRSSELNSCLQRFFGIKLQTWPRVQLLLRSFENGYIRKVAKPFTLAEVKKFLAMDFKHQRFWLVRQAVVAVGFAGGLRCTEVKGLMIENLRKTEEGFYIDFFGAKQRGEVKQSSFLVPYDNNNGSGGFGEKLEEYLHQVEEDTGCTTGPLIRGCSGGKKFVKSPMGRTYVLKICKEVAAKLQLPQPEKYTGHALRRSSAMAAGDSGANTVDLKRFFRWKADSMPMKYIDASNTHTTAMATMITGVEVQATSSKAEGGELVKEKEAEVSEGSKSVAKAVDDKADEDSNMFYKDSAKPKGRINRLKLPRKKFRKFGSGKNNKVTNVMINIQ